MGNDGNAIIARTEENNDAKNTELNDVPTTKSENDEKFIVNKELYLEQGPKDEDDCHNQQSFLLGPQSSSHETMQEDKDREENGFNSKN